MALIKVTAGHKPVSNPAANHNTHGADLHECCKPNCSDGV
jgi:hypothetical protein